LIELEQKLCLDFGVASHLRNGAEYSQIGSRNPEYTFLCLQECERAKPHQFLAWEPVGYPGKGIAGARTSYNERSLLLFLGMSTHNHHFYTSTCEQLAANPSYLTYPKKC